MHLSPAAIESAIKLLDSRCLISCGETWGDGATPSPQQDTEGQKLSREWLSVGALLRGETLGGGVRGLWVCSGPRETRPPFLTTSCTPVRPQVPL